MRAKGLLLSVYRAAIESAHPKKLFHGFSFSLPSGTHPLLLLGAGKAAYEMSKAFVRRVRPLTFTGSIIVPEHSPHGPISAAVQVLEGSHPYVSAKSLLATQVLLKRFTQLSADQEIVFLLSGGASALLERPVSAIAFSHLRATCELLFSSGADIQELNVVRKHLSQVKGGRLALAMGKSKCTTLVLSDVENNRLDVIGSGPTYPDSSTYEEALAVLRKFKLTKRISQSVMRFLTEGARGIHPETPTRLHPVFKNHTWIVVGSRAEALDGAKKKGKELGLPVRVLSEFLKGEAVAIGRRLARLGRRLPPGTLLIASGEPTVRVVGRGKGGRCQEAALAFLVEGRGAREMYLLAAGTDGMDGPTDAAGAFASNRSFEKSIHQGLDPEKFLRNNDSFTFFDRLGDLFRTGLTGTNVNDLFLLWMPETGTFQPDSESL